MTANARVLNVFITYYLSPTCLFAFVTIFRVTYKNIMNPNSLSKCVSEPIDVTKKS